MSDEKKWTGDYGEVVIFAHVLVRSFGWGAAELLEYLEKPWKWSDEHEKWDTAQRPEVMP